MVEHINNLKDIKRNTECLRSEDIFLRATKRKIKNKFEERTVAIFVSSATPTQPKIASTTDSQGAKGDQALSDNKTIHIDLETKELLVASLNHLEMFADAQVDQETEYEIRLINRELGDKFGLTLPTVEAIESKDADGNLVITLKANKEKDSEASSNAKAKRHLRLVKPNEDSPSADAEQLDTLDTE